MDNDDILNLLDDGDVLEKTPSTSFNKQSGQGKQNNQTNKYYNKLDVEPVKLSRENMITDNKSFMLALSTKGDDLPEDVKAKIRKVMTYLASKGLTYRHNTGMKDEFSCSLLELFENKEGYLPWRSFNPGVQAPVVFHPTELAYKVLAAEHRFFSKLPDNVRAIVASEVNVILGKDCQKPVKFILAYSPCGSEGFKKGMDYKLLGGVNFPMHLSKVYEIPLININSKDFSGEKLSKFL